MNVEVSPGLISAEYYLLIVSIMLQLAASNKTPKSGELNGQELISLRDKKLSGRQMLS